MKISSGDFDSKIAGIPCQVLVTECFYEAPSHDCPGADTFEFELYDRKGYRAKWLEAKVTRDDCERLREEYRKYCQSLWD